MSLILKSFTITPKVVRKSNNDVTITLHYEGRITQDVDNAVTMNAVIIEPDVSFVDNGSLRKSCSWDENFTTTNAGYTKKLVVRVLVAPAQTSICDVRISGETKGGHIDNCDSSFKFSK